MSDCFRGFGRTAARKVLIGNGGYVDLNIDAIHERSGDFRHVTLNLRRRAETLPAEIMGKSAWTGIHRSDQDEGRWKCERHLRTCDGDSALLRWSSLLRPGRRRLMPLTW